MENHLQESGETVNLNNDIMFEILRRVEPGTLATASCVNSEFRSVAEEEDLWEKLCNERWPSTKDSQVKSILASVGGYRKFYAHCYPSIVNEARPADRGHEHEKARSDYSPSDFISIVDVVYGEQSVFSKTVKGIAGADDIHGWFSACPFRVDLLSLASENGTHEEGQNAIVIDVNDLPSMTSRSSVLKRGSPWNTSKLWKMLCDKMRVSWILINKKTLEMANLASWKPVGGFRHWLCDGNFLLRFGSVLPGSDSSVNVSRVRCDISVVCSLSFAAGESTKATLQLSELSLQLENFEGALVNGRESVAILHNALSCPKRGSRKEMVDSYHHYLRVRSDLKAKEVSGDALLNVAAALTSGIASCLFFMWLFV